MAVSQVADNKFRALDFGSGTGNVTGKLLDLGFEVTAVDLSSEMSKILKLKFKKDVEIGKLHLLSFNIDEVQVEGSFDFVSCYSVIHHLPNYLGTVRKLARLIRKGGILYFDHEPAPLFTQRNPDCFLNHAISFAHYFTEGLLDRLYFWSFNVPKFDYSKADVHARNGELNYRRIVGMLRKKGFNIVDFRSYYSADSWFRLPLAPFHKIMTGPNTALLIAKKTM